MNDLAPRIPTRPLQWPDFILDLADLLTDTKRPIYIVGGAVRDAYFGAPLHDIDLTVATGATPLARRIANLFNGDVYVMDAERDVARVIAETAQGRFSIDVAAFRAPDLRDDLTERDFTINAIAVDLHNPAALIDPLDGEADLKKRLIRRCSAHAIASDPIRGLRAVRQSLQLNAHIEKQTMLDIRANAGALYTTSPERVRDEFIKLLSGQRPHAALRVMKTLGLLDSVLPEVTALPEPRFEAALRSVEHLAAILSVISPKRTDNTAAAFGLGAMVVALDRFRGQLREHLSYEWPNDRPHPALLHLAVLLRTAETQNAGALADDIAEHLRLSNPERARLGALLKADASLITGDAPLDDLAQHRYWHNFGAAGIDVLILALAGYLSAQGVELQRDPWIKILERARILLDAYFARYNEIVAPPSVIDGNVLMSVLNISPGPIIRELLDHVREAQVTGVVTDRDGALSAARDYLAGRA